MNLIKYMQEKPNIDYYLRNFRRDLKKQNRKSKTIANYISDLRHYLNWIAEKG